MDSQLPPNSQRTPRELVLLLPPNRGAYIGPRVGVADPGSRGRTSSRRARPRPRRAGAPPPSLGPRPVHAAAARWGVWSLIRWPRGVSAGLIHTPAHAM